MKTTIEISNDLMKKAKALASKRQTTLRTIIESSLRAALKEEQQAENFSLPDLSVGGKGLQEVLRDRLRSDIRDTSYEGRGS